MLTCLLTATCVYIVFLCIHWIPFKITTVVHRTRTMTRTLLLCLPLGVLFFSVFSKHIPQEIDNAPFVGALFSLVLFTLFWCGYVQFIFSFDTSPSLRVLVEILNRKSTLSEKEITNIMDFPETFHRRFFRAAFNGAIVQHKNENTHEVMFTNTPVGRFFAKRGKFAKQFFNLGAGG